MDNKEKIIRDVVHGYITIDNLTEKLINTYKIQRLKDNRQLTHKHIIWCYQRLGALDVIYFKFVNKQ